MCERKSSSHVEAITCETSAEIRRPELFGNVMPSDHAGLAPRFLLQDRWLIALHYKFLICTRMHEKKAGTGEGWYLGTNWAEYCVYPPPTPINFRPSNALEGKAVRR